MTNIPVVASFEKRVFIDELRKCRLGELQLRRHSWGLPFRNINVHTERGSGEGVGRPFDEFTIIAESLSKMCI